MHAFTSIFLFVLLCVTAPGSRAAIEGPTGVTINGNTLDAATVSALERIYRVSVQPGHYWYDTVSGLWGRVGGPPLGRMNPNHALGALPADASHSQLDVYLNGRRIHLEEARFLFNCFGQLQPGRYWMNYAGVGGLEGGPPFFDVSVCFRRGGGGNNGGSLSSGYFITGGAVLGN